MGVSFNTCGGCGETYCDCESYAYCEDCDEGFCSECMEKHHLQDGTITKAECPLCNVKVVNEKTLLAFLINELGTTYEDAKKAFEDRVKSGARKAFPAEKQLYKDGYSDAVTEYAVWKDGEQFVGVLQKPLSQVLQEVDERFNI